MPPATSDTSGRINNEKNPFGRGDHFLAGRVKKEGVLQGKSIISCALSFSRLTYLAV